MRKKGFKHSEETKRKMSLAQKGKVAMSPEALKRMAATKRGKPAPWMIGNKNVAGVKNPFYGKFGKNHPCWREVKKHPFHKQIRECFKYRQWRSDVFTRDDFTCAWCTARGVHLEADHFPKMFIEIIEEYGIKTLEGAYQCEELWNINNGRTLCVKCHNTTRKGRRKNS